MTDLRLLFDTAVAAHQAGNLDQAIAGYRQLTLIQPTEGVFWQNLAIAYDEMGLSIEAIFAYRQALQCNPALLTCHINLVGLLTNRWVDILTHGEAVIQAGVPLESLPLDFLDVVAEAAYRSKQPALAETLTQHCLDRNPEEHTALLRLAMIAQQGKDHPKAIALYRQLAEKWPNESLFHLTLAELHEKRLETADALQHLDRAIAIQPRDAWRIRRALTLPGIYRNRDDLLHWRSELSEGIQTIKSGPSLSFKQLEQEVDRTHFYLAYQGMNDLEMAQAIAGLYAPYLPIEQFHSPSPRTRPRVGIISFFFYHHSITQCFGNLLLHLSRQDFDLVLIKAPNSPEDQVTRQLREQVSLMIDLPNDLAKARDIISDLRLDVLIYLDIGMTPFTYFLAMTRLAPTQCVFPGHPVTTGLPQLDYFFSSAQNEPVNAQEHYSEKLVRLNGTYVNYSPLKIPTEMDRASLGLPEQGNLYICPSTLFKIHPDCDEVIGSILGQDRSGHAIFFGMQNNTLAGSLRNRFEHNLADVSNRIHILPWLSQVDLLRVMRHACVLLDPLHFSGTNTAHFAFSLGVPLITWPSAYLRGRFAAGLYRRMEIADCIAKSPEHYSDLAVEIASDSERRADIVTQIQARSPDLFGNDSGVGEIARFLWERIEQGRR